MWQRCPCEWRKGPSTQHGRRPIASKNLCGLRGCLLRLPLRLWKPVSADRPPLCDWLARNAELREEFQVIRVDPVLGPPRLLFSDIVAAETPVANPGEHLGRGDAQELGHFGHSQGSGRLQRFGPSGVERPLHNVRQGQGGGGSLVAVGTAPRNMRTA